MPADPDILLVQYQGDQLCVWARVQVEAEALAKVKKAAKGKRKAKKEEMEE